MMTSYYDSLLMEHLKQEFCHLNLDKCGCMERTVTIKKPEKPQMEYTIQVKCVNK